MSICSGLAAILNEMLKAICGRISQTVHMILDDLEGRVFNSGRLGVNTPKNVSPYAQILRRGRPN